MTASAFRSLRPTGQLCRLQRSRPSFGQAVHRCSASSDKEANDGAGDPNLQDELAEMLQKEVRSKRNKDELDKEVDYQKFLLIQAAQEAKEEIDKAAQLNKLRSDLAFGSATADIEESYREFNEQLLESRKRMEDDEVDFDNFQEKVASDRNAGLIFQSLYADPELEARQRKRRGGAGRLLNDMEAQQQADEEMRRAHEGLQNPARLIWSTGLSMLLLSACVVDIVQGEPSWGIITLYVIIAGCFGAIALAERLTRKQWERELSEYDAPGSEKRLKQ